MSATAPAGVPPPSVTRDLARFAVGATLADMPDDVRREAPRAWLNILGCMLGGCDEPTVMTTLALARRLSGPPEAGVVGHDVHVDVLHAALINGLSSTVYVFDDTHLETVLHPSGPVAAAVLALADQTPVSGKSLAEALLIGIEVSCRAAMILASNPAECHPGFSMTGLAGGIGAAAAAGRLLGLDIDQMEVAIGTAAAQGAGFRQTHSSMAGYFVVATSARTGLLAALLAKDGFTCSPRALEGPRGFGQVYASNPNFGAAIDGLGERYELLSNTYKPYPCGVVIHPVIDACLEIASSANGAAIEAVEINVHPLAIELTSNRNPTDELQAQVSLYHWAAAVLVNGRAGFAESRLAAIKDPVIVGLSERIQATARDTIAKEAATVRVRYADGTVREVSVQHCRGSLQRPMTDAELTAKFNELSANRLDSGETQALLQQCLELDRVADVSATFRTFLGRASRRL